VQREFEKNFLERGDVGAAFAAYQGGELLVDLWGGLADSGADAPWSRSTACVIFSGTKGLVATCLLKLIEMGQLELEEPAARYWPEFAAQGKGEILVHHIVSHSAGLPGFHRRLRLPDLLEDRYLAALLAQQTPRWPPGEQLCYHALTFGWLCGELIRRIDGRSIGRFFADEIARPLQLDIWIGLPRSLENRVARLELAPAWGESITFRRAEGGTDELAASVWENPPFFRRDCFPWNSSQFHAAEIPGAGGVATTQSMARLYACLACGGQLDGVRILGEHTLQLGRAELSRGTDPVSDELMAFGVGFALQTDLRVFGPPANAFGHGGAGGSIHGAWPTERVGFSYVMNLMRDDDRDVRASALLSALHAALAERPQVTSE
jgi:CubicO group peptidase (beta-lactamase class C family)